MNKKGFTLIELLAVITILGILIVFVSPLVLNTKTLAENSISEQEKREIIDAAKLFAIDLDDKTSEIYNCNSISGCTKDANGIWKKVSNLNINVLKNKKYLDDSANHYKGKITITRNGYNYDINISKITKN